MLTYTIKDPIYIETDTEGHKALGNLLLYKSVHYRRGMYKMERHESVASMAIKKGRKNPIYSIPTGFLYSMEQHLKKTGAKYEILNPYEIKPLKFKSIDLPGVELRDLQIPLIEKALKNQRGILVSPTGTGKTVLASSICTALRDYQGLFLVHTKSLLKQTHKEFLRFNIDSSMYGDGIKNLNGDVVVATVQSLSKLPIEEIVDLFDYIIVDECHHVTKADGQYVGLLSKLLAPTRIGLTATPPDDPLILKVMEGYIGPILEEVTVNACIEKGYLAKPVIKIVKSKLDLEVRALRKYPEVYDAGIVHNKHRNNQIVDIALDYVDQKMSVLINVEKLEHGDNLCDLLEQEDVRFTFVEGIVSSDKRERIKSMLDRGKLDVVIATKSWREGVNIPSLNVVINAAGGKSEISTLQFVGRGLRVTDKKKELIIVDFFDPSHFYLISHFGERIALYCEKGWL